MRDAVKVEKDTADSRCLLVASTCVYNRHNVAYKRNLENQRNAKLEEESVKDSIKVYMPDSHSSSHLEEGLSCLSLGKSVI